MIMSTSKIKRVRVMEIQNLLKKAMVDAGVKSAAELSRKSGVSQKIIGNFLRGGATSGGNIVTMFNSMGFNLVYIKKDQ